jgi:hypothetical protein
MQTGEDFQVVINKKPKRQLNASSTDDSSDDDTHVKKASGKSKSYNMRIKWCVERGTNSVGK